MSGRIFRYGQEATNHLKKRDRILGGAIDRIGIIEREVTPDLFVALVQSIAGQQVSAKAAATAFARMQERFGSITPQALAAAGTGDLQGCGISARKAGYISGIATAVLDGSLDLESLRTLPDEDVIQRLTAHNGVGRWTAEMLLIFSLQRPDVVSESDHALRRGMMSLYGQKTLSNEQFARYRKRYSPYGSVASLYLWAVSHER